MKLSISFILICLIPNFQLINDSSSFCIKLKSCFPTSNGKLIILKQDEIYKYKIVNIKKDTFPLVKQGNNVLILLNSKNCKNCVSILSNYLNKLPANIDKKVIASCINSTAARRNLMDNLNVVYSITSMPIFFDFSAFNGIEYESRAGIMAHLNIIYTPALIHYSSTSGDATYFEYKYIFDENGNLSTNFLNIFEELNK